MQEETKEEVWKVTKVILFLFVSIFIILPYLVQVSTFFHERAHQRNLDKYSVKNDYEANLFSTIPSFFNPKTEALGVTRFNFAQYLQLDKYQRTEVNIAGIVSDLRLLILAGVYLACVNIYLFYKIKIKKEYNFIWVLAVNWILFIWLLVLMQVTIANITYSAGDVYQLVRFLKI